MRRLGVALLWLALAAVPGFAAFGIFTTFVPVSNSLSPLGTNLSGIASFSTEQPFASSFANGFGWITANNSVSDTGEEADVCTDTNGWVTDLAHKLSAGVGSPCTTIPTFTFVTMTVTNAQISPYYKSGNWDLLYTGTCGISWSGDATGTTGGTGHDVINVVTPSTQGVIFKITNVSSGGTACKNISFTPSSLTANFQTNCVYGGNASQQTGCWNPKFLAFIANFKTLRFMDWFAINGAEDTSVSTRPTTSLPFYGNGSEGNGNASFASGVPLETAIALCNLNNSDCWINLPALYTDSAVNSIATIALAQLNSNLNVYVELSNEPWNASMLSWNQFVTLGRATFAGSLGSDNDYALNYYGYRAQQVCSDWKTIWAGHTSRVACVYEAQAANTYSATEGLGCPFAQLAPISKGSDCSSGIDVIAIAPYLFGDTPTAWTALGGDGGLTCFFNQIGVAGQTCSVARLPTGNGNSTTGTASAFALTTGLSLSNPPPNGTCVPVSFNNSPNNGATMAVDGGTAFILTDNNGGNVSNAGVFAGPFDMCYTSSTSAGSVTASWRVLSFETQGFSGGWLAQLASYISAYQSLISGTYTTMKLVTYEGGEQFLNPLNAAVLTTLYNNASADSRMGTAAQTLIGSFKTASGHNFNWYFDIGANGQFGNFGQALTICDPNCTSGTPTATKWVALQTYIAANPKGWSFP